MLAVLRMLSCGNFEQTAADYIGISQPTMAKILPSVCDAILLHFDDIVRMPRTEHERLAKASEFAKLAGFPRCIGAIDCTHVRLSSPGGEISEAFRNRRGYFSMNVQTICDSNMRIQNVVARWPGSTHDSTIFKHSVVQHNFEAGEYEEYLLVADSGYENTFYLCTPFTQHRDAAQLSNAEKVYQRAILTTRNVVERSYGLLKRRFPILMFGMQLKRLSLIQKIISVCCMLHNICIDMGDAEVDDLPMPTNSVYQDPVELAAPVAAPPLPQLRRRKRPIARISVIQMFTEMTQNLPQ